MTTKKVEKMVLTEEVYRGLDKQEDTFKVVNKNVAKKQEAVRKRKIKKGEVAVFTVGDQVLIKNVKEQERKGGKMESTFLGPLVVLQVRGKFATLASLNSPRKTVANVDILTHFIEPERIPAKLKKVGTSPLASPSPPPSSPDPPLGTLPGERQPSQSNSTFSYVTLYSIIMISSLFNYYVFNLQFLNESGQGSKEK